MKNICVVLYENFTALDVFGPVEVLGNIDEYELHYVSLGGGIVTNSQGIKIETEKINTFETCEIILIPGGLGSRIVINEDEFICSISNLMKKAMFTLCVCTGSALAAKTGLLNGREATSNKTAFDWVVSMDDKVLWNRKARWVADGNLYTSAGVSAGTDMAVGFIRDQFGVEKADQICRRMEYHWNSNADEDTF